MHQMINERWGRDWYNLKEQGGGGRGFIDHKLVGGCDLMDLMLDIYLWLVDTCNFLFTPVFQLYFSATATAPATTVVYTVHTLYHGI